MRGRRAMTAAVAALSLCGGAAVAQEHHGMHPMPAAKVEVRSADGPVTVPFRLAGNHVVIPITVQGTRLEVVLDTGMPMDGVMLYRNDRVGRLDLTPEKGMTARIAGAGGDGGHVAADIVRDLTIDIGRVRLTGAKAIVAPPIHAFASDHDGVIGASLFRNFVVAIDFDAGRITLHEPKGWAPPPGSVAVPLTLEGNFPYAEVVILTPDERRIPARVVVDLGASHPISLNVGAIAGFEAPAGAIRAIIGRGVGGMVRGRVGRIAGLELGGIALRDVVATLPDSEHQRPGGMKAEGGNLGTGLLRHFNVTFDYGRATMLLSPNKGFGRPFEWDMSGLWLEPDEKAGLRIAFIVDNSAAAQAGLVVGDILARVDDRSVTAKDLPAIKERLRQEGETLALMLTRDGKPIEATLRLKRLV